MNNDNTHDEFEYATPVDSSITTAEGTVLTAEEAIAQAEARVAEVVAGQQDWAKEDLAVLLKACAAAQREPQNRAQHFKLVFARAHDLKGMGTSFGYELVTEVGASLCDYLRDNPEGELEIVALLARSLKLIVDEGMRGDAGEDGQKLVSGLRKVVKRRASVSNLPGTVMEEHG